MRRTDELERGNSPLRAQRRAAARCRGRRRVAINLASALAVVLASGATSALGGGLAPASSAATRCFPSSARIILKDHVAAIADTADGLIACDYNVRSPQLVDSPIDTIFAFRGPSLSLNGSYLGFAVDDCDPNAVTCVTRVVRIDLTERYAGPTGFPAQPIGKPYVKVGSLRVGRHGGLIWIVCPERGDSLNLLGKQTPNCVRPGDRDTVITLAAGAKSEVILDSGRQIDPSSLRLSGTTAGWSHSGRTRHARLS